MEYNTSLNRLVIPEYGRNIQKMIEYAMTIEDKEKRNKMAKAIISFMGQLNPHLRDVNDFKHKLWDHLIIMSDFKIDVDSPYPLPSKEQLSNKPQRLVYPENNIKYKHYGKIIQQIINKVAEMPEGRDKDVLIKAIVYQLKRSYQQWNKDNPSDDVIIQHLTEMSKGGIKYNPELHNKPMPNNPNPNNQQKSKNFTYNPKSKYPKF